MAEKMQIYKCEVCGNIVEVLHGGKGELVCCNEPMKLFKENTVDAAKEKHVPVIKRDGDMVKVKVGSVDHPMEEKHYIEWIFLATKKGGQFKHLRPGDEPKAEFKVVDDEVLAVYEHCNIHGLYKMQIK